MKEIDLDSLIEDFSEIEKKLEETSQGRDARLLKLEPNKKPYVLRFLPNMTARQLLVPAFVYEWTNSKTKYVWGGFSPKTFDSSAEPCLYDTTRNQMFEDEQRDFAKCLFPIPYRYVNVLVIDDPNNSENNGEVRVLRYRAKPHRDGVVDSGSPIHMAIQEQIDSPSSSKVLFTNLASARVMHMKVKKSAVGFKYDIEFKEAGVDLDISKFDVIDITELFDKPFTPEKMEETINTKLLMKKSRRSRLSDENAEDEPDTDDDSDNGNSDPLDGLSPHVEEPAASAKPEAKPKSKPAEKTPASDVNADLDALFSEMEGDS